MIYTVTFNPSIDYNIKLDEFVQGDINRSKDEYVLIGGKGVNVSTVLKNLGLDSTVLGFISGFTGDLIEKSLTDYGLKFDFIRVNNGFSRINVKIKGKSETEINGSGPDISRNEIDMLMRRLSNLKDGDFLVLAGSIPKSVLNTIYSDIMEMLLCKNIYVIVDATGDLLLNVLKFRPFLIKPNNFELEELFNVKLGNDKEKIIKYARKLQDMGARNVLVSMAGDGAVFCTQTNEVFVSEAPSGKVINSVGAGDSMVAGFLTGWLEQKDYSHAFKMGISAGSASAFSENLAEKDEIMQVYSRL